MESTESDYSLSETESYNRDYHTHEINEITQVLINLGFTAPHNKENKSGKMRRNNLLSREPNHQRNTWYPPSEGNEAHDDDDYSYNTPPLRPARDSDAHVYEIYTRASDTLGD